MRTSQVASQAVAEATRSISTPPGWDAYPQDYIHPFIYVAWWAWVRFQCLTKEKKTMSSARTRTQTARSGIERSDHA